MEAPQGKYKTELKLPRVLSLQKKRQEAAPGQLVMLAAPVGPRCIILSHIITTSERFDGGRRGSVVCMGGEAQRALFAPLPLFLSQRKVQGSWLHLEMRLCVSNLGTGKKGSVL